jgi:hypothetical protein
VLEDRTVPASLSYSTFLHGTVYATAVDGAGNVYVTGHSDGNLPTTPGAFQTSGSGAFVAKLNATGTALIYATYLGNDTSYHAAGTGIAVDSAGDAYVIGVSVNVPTTPNAIASSSARSVFIAELNPTGSALLYSTYLPGAVDSIGLIESYAGAMAVDGSGNIYVAGAAEAGLPVTAGAFQPIKQGSAVTNAYLVEINPALSGTASLVYSSYLGSSGEDAATGIALDGAGNAYLEGYTYTYSPNFPTTPGAFQTAAGGHSHTFVAKFNPSLSGSASLVYSTYLGGSGDDGLVSNNGTATANEIAGGIAVDSAGNAYVTSATKSTDFPTTQGAYQVTTNLVHSRKSTRPGSDAFVAKLNATGSALIYSTYLGGGGSKSGDGTYSGGAGIAVDSSGNAHVTGWTNSTVFPTQNALQTANAGDYDAFVTVLNPSGSGLLFSSYFGGSGTDYGYGIALDSAGNAYVGGQAGSSNFPTTPGAYQTTPGGGFVLKIDPPADLSEVSVPLIAGRTTVAVPRRGTLSEPLAMTPLLPAAPSAAPSVSATGDIVASPPSVLVPVPIVAAQPQRTALLSGGSEETVDQIFIDWLPDELSVHDS